MRGGLWFLLLLLAVHWTALALPPPSLKLLPKRWRILHKAQLPTSETWVEAKVLATSSETPLLPFVSGMILRCSRSAWALSSSHLRGPKSNHLNQGFCRAGASAVYIFLLQSPAWLNLPGKSTQRGETVLWPQLRAPWPWGPMAGRTFPASWQTGLLVRSLSTLSLSSQSR